MRQNITDLSTLADLLQLGKNERQALISHPRFALNLPFRLASKIEKGTLNDPILRQFVPLIEEGQINAAFTKDPVGDQLCRKASKLIHKYHGRVLLVSTSACAMHCRYCFRQHFDYETRDKTFDQELKLIAADPTINEVILSGGDPLSLDQRVLSGLLDALAEIPHIRKVRFHTRFPIGIPERIDASFLQMLGESRLQFWFVIHTNHVRELDSDVLSAMKSIQKLGIPVLNMSVLLKGVNDTADDLVALFGKLADHGIFPYYLNQLDRVQGAAHFEVDEWRGKELMKEITNRLPGYAVPRYIKEVAGELAKTIIV